MKKILLLFGLILIFMPNVKGASVPYGSNQAPIIYQQIKDLKSKIGNINYNCDDVSLRVNLRWALADGHVIDFFKDSKRNACLRKDLDYLDKNLDQIAEKISISEIACGDVNGFSVTEAVQQVKDIRQQITCLRRYGEGGVVSVEDEELCPIDYKDYIYTDVHCTEEVSKEIFSEVKKSWAKLKQALKDVKDTSWSDVDLSIDNQAIAERGQARAEEWKKNMLPSFSGQNFNLEMEWVEPGEWGIDIISEDKKGQEQKLADETEKHSPKKEFVPMYGVRSIIYGKLEAADLEYKFARDLSKMFARQDISDKSNFSVLLNLDQILLNMQNSLQNVLIIENGLQEKTKALKSLLDTHNK